MLLRRRYLDALSRAIFEHLRSGQKLSNLPLSTAIEIIGSLHHQLRKSAESPEKRRRAGLLAEPFPGTVAQGVSLFILKERPLAFGLGLALHYPRSGYWSLSVTGPDIKKDGCAGNAVRHLSQNALNQMEQIKPGQLKA